MVPILKTSWLRVKCRINTYIHAYDIIIAWALANTYNKQSICWNCLKSYEEDMLSGCKGIQESSINNYTNRLIFAGVCVCVVGGGEQYLAIPHKMVPCIQPTRLKIVWWAFCTNKKGEWNFRLSAETGVSNGKSTFLARTVKDAIHFDIDTQCGRSTWKPPHRAMWEDYHAFKRADIIKYGRFVFIHVQFVSIGSRLNEHIFQENHLTVDKL